MTNSSTKRHRTIAYSLMFFLTLAVVRTPAVRGYIVGALVNFVEVTENVARLPCWIVDHSHCFSLDRLDPTCPQCF